jgi:hypothetical protein
MLETILLFTINCSIFAHVAGRMKERALTSFEGSLHKQISIFDAKRGSLVENLLRIVYRFQPPFAREYVDRQAVIQPSGIVLRNVTTRQAIEALVQRLPINPICWILWFPASTYHTWMLP